MMRLAWVWLVVSVMVAGAAGAPALAQVEGREAIQLQNQMLELRRDVQGLRDQVNRLGGSSLGGSRGGSSASQGGGDTTALLERVSSLEELVRRLQGKLDEAENNQRRRGDELRKEIEDLNFKLSNGASVGAAPARPPAAPLAVPTALPTGVAPAVAVPPAAASRRTPEVALQQGNAALARRDYATAEAAAREVLAFPRSPRVTDAQFLLAQTLAGKRDHTAAAVAFDDAYNRSRTGAQAQPALLGLANSLVAIGEKRAACATLEKLKAEFPTVRADLRDAVNDARQRSNCR